MDALYDTIGVGYAQLRKPDPRIEQAIHPGLGDAKTTVNVGAGSGSYEPSDKFVVAVELSPTMIGQRPPNIAPAVQASATALPLGDAAFDASLAILTVHHWPDKKQGLLELRRVSRDRVVILTWDPGFKGFWLTDYIPQILEQDILLFPLLQDYEALLGPVDVIDVPIPFDCIDGFMCAYWRRPRAYLDAKTRSAISTFSKLGDILPGLEKLERDLDSGEWYQRYADLLDRTELDLGYRLIIAM